LERDIPLALISRLILIFLILLLLLLLFILIPDLLLQDNAIHTSLEQGAHGRSLAFKEAEAIERHGGGGASEVGEFIGQLRRRIRQ
jgi:hypothetical protein